MLGNESSLEQERLIRKLVRIPIAVLVGGSGLFLVSQTIGYILAQPFDSYLRSNNLQIMIILCLSLLSLVGLLSMLLASANLSWRSLGLGWPRYKSWWLLLPTLLGYLIFSAMLTVLAIKFIPGFQSNQAQDVGFDFTTLKQPAELALTFVSLVILTPIFEEIIFRGVIFKGLRRRLSFWPSAILSSLLFAVAHGQWNVGIDTFVLGLALCFLMQRSHSLLPSIILHSLKNSLAFTLLVLFS